MLRRRGVTYILHILTHGRRYTEEYETFDEALTAAIALEHEPRERAQAITCGEEECADRADIERLAQERNRSTP